jgi:spermidine synthase
MQLLPIILMGASSIILQILCLRQLLSTFSGNELVIGITLAAWLAIVSLGSYAGSRIKLKNAFALSFIAIALVSQPTIIIAKSVRPILGYELGEVIPLASTIVWTALTMIALCLIIGIQFPLAVHYLRERSPEVYSFEALGAFAGGALFTFLLAGRVDTYSIVMITAVMNIFIAVLLSKRKAVFLLLIFPIIFQSVGMKILSSHQYKGMELVKRTESRYGEIVVLRTKDQLNVYSSEKFQFSYPDPQTEELKSHLPMSINPNSEKVLVVGGSPAVIKEFLNYPVSRVDFVEIDPVMVEVSKDLLNPEDKKYLNDKRVQVINIDARRYIKLLPAAGYDLIILNIPEPSTANINRFYTKEFFEETKSALGEGGMLYLNLPVSYGYIGRRMQMANGSIYKSLKEVFPHVEVSSEEYGIIAASVNPIETNPDVLTGRLRAEKPETKYFRSYILGDAFSPLKVSMVKERLGKITELNSDIRPVSYLYNLMLWSEIHGGKWLNLVLGLNQYMLLVYTGIFLTLTALCFVKKGATVSYVIFTTGYITLAFALIIILAYQAYSGYIYEVIGLLSGTFMLGGAVGAYAMRSTQKPLRWLRLFDLLTIILIFLAVLFMNREMVFYIFIFAAGILGGGQFATANLSLREKVIEGIAGKLYAVDLAGSFLGSFLTAVFMIPLAGIRNTLLFLILIKTLSLMLLIRYRNV